MPNRGRPFKPGDSRINRRGRPSVPDCLSECLRAVAAEPARAGQTKAQALAAVLWRKALAGDLRAAALVLDRVEGRPPQAVAVTADGVHTSVQYFGVDVGIAERVAQLRASGELGDSVTGKG